MFDVRIGGGVGGMQSDKLYLTLQNIILSSYMPKRLIFC